MTVIIYDKNDLSLFRRWYLKKHNVDVKEEFLGAYHTGRHHLPTMVKLNASNKISSHQGVDEKGDTIQDFIRNHPSYHSWLDECTTLKKFLYPEVDFGKK